MFGIKMNKNPEIINDPVELLKNAPKWCIKDRKPSKFWNKGKEFIQVVLLSKITGMRSFWAVWDGVGLVRTDNRAYEVPKENLYGDVFIWDIDKKKSITEIISVEDNDAEDSFHELQMFNMAYSVGRQAGANELDNKLRTIFIITIITMLASIICVLLVYQETKEIKIAVENVRVLIDSIPKLPHA